MRYLFALAIALLLAQPFLIPSAHAAETTRKKARKADSDDRSLAVVEKNRDGRKRVALVIGNSSYTSSPLRNPVNDARAMAATLRRIGFDVEEKTDLGYVAMNKAVEGFGKRLAAGGVGLFYYAGHGVQVQGANYLLPVDAEIDDENEVRYKAVDAGLVLAKMEQARGDVNLVVLDACRNNPFARSFRSAARGLASMDAPSGSMIAYATAPGKTAADGSGRNGVYTEELIRMMETPGLSVEEAFKRVRKAVMSKTASAQVPWESSSLTGDFHFVPPASMTDLQPSPVQPQPVEPPKKQLPGKPVAEEPVVPVATALRFTEPTTGMEFVSVPAGCFTANGKQTCIDAFRIGTYEVTQGQYRRIMGSNPSSFSSCGDDCPVEQVSWDDAQSFISRLNSQTDKQFRLPTEAEWEYACRSGGKNEEYCGGNDVGAVAWYSKNSDIKTHRVGQKQPNGLGIYDMSGNVREWVQDWFGTYPSSDNNPIGASSGSNRVSRGGSWSYSAEYARAAYRYADSPDYRYFILGFRLASPVQ
ncbi:MAG: caspase family protein [Desulfuromonadales bacterium]